MTKCVKVLQSKSKAKSMDQSQARIKPFRPKSEPVIGPCFLLCFCSVIVRDSLRRFGLCIKCF